METAVIVASILGLIFGLLGLVASAVACIIVLGWRNSTHRVVQLPVPETRYELDMPPGVAPDASQLPSEPEQMTPQEYARRARESSFDEIYGSIES